VHVNLVYLYYILFCIGDCCSGDKIVAWKEGERGGEYMFLVAKPEGKRPLGRPRHRWEDNIKMDLEEVGWGHGLVWLRIQTSGGLL
jgi:hypothetical protein